MSNYVVKENLDKILYETLRCYEIEENTVHENTDVAVERHICVLKVCQELLKNDSTLELAKQLIDSHHHLIPCFDRPTDWMIQMITSCGDMDIQDIFRDDVCTVEMVRAQIETWASLTNVAKYIRNNMSEEIASIIHREYLLSIRRIDELPNGEMYAKEYYAALIEPFEDMHVIQTLLTKGEGYVH